MPFNLKENVEKSCTTQNVIAYLKHFFPILVWLPNYQLADLRYDIIAGFTVGMTMVPQCLAYAQMSNVRGEFGLYAAFAGQFFYLAMGTSKDASIGPSAISSMLAGQANAAANPLYERGDATCCAIMSLFSGCILLTMGVLKLGFIVNFFSIPVVSGFTSAAGLTIASSQLKSFFGLKKNPSDVPGAFVKQIKNVVDNHDEINWNDFAFGISALGFLFFMQYLPLMVDSCVKKWIRLDTERRRASYATFTEAFKLIVASRNVMLFFIATGTAYALTNGGTGGVRISLVGTIKPGLPSLAIPSFQLVDERKINITVNGSSGNFTTIIERVVIKESRQLLSDLIVAYIVIPLLGAMELFAITKALGRKNGYRVDARQELVAIGIANIFQAFLNGIPVTAAVTRCALNDQCRVRTLLASLISCIIVMIAISELTGTFYFIPKATLAAIIMSAALNLIDYHIVPDMWRRCRGDCALLIFTFIICVFFEISYGVLFCLFLNMLMFLKAVARMQLQVTRKQLGHNFYGEDGSICVVRISHGMKYPSADKFLDKMNALLAKESHLIIDCTFIQNVDYTGIQSFRSLLLSAVQRGLHIMFTNLNDEVHQQLASLGLEQYRFVGSVEEAVAEYNKAILLSELEGAAFKMSTIPEDQVVTANIEEAITPRPSLVEDEEAKEVNERARRRLIRQLSIEPTFFQEIPFTVGGNVDLPGGVEDVVLNADARRRGFNPPEGNVQFMNRTLLREVSRRHSQISESRSRTSSVATRVEQPRSRPSSMTAPSEPQVTRRVRPSAVITRQATSELIESAHNQDDLWDAIQRISISPAIRFIDMSDLSEFSPRTRSNPVDTNISL